MERDKLRIKLDQLRSGKSFEELDEGLDVQVRLFAWEIRWLRTPRVYTFDWFESMNVQFKCISWSPSVSDSDFSYRRMNC